MDLPKPENQPTEEEPSVNLCVKVPLSLLKRSKSRFLFEIVTGWATRVEDLHRALLEYQPTIVHFSGHGDGSNHHIFQALPSELPRKAVFSDACTFLLVNKNPANYNVSYAGFAYNPI